MKKHIFFSNRNWKHELRSFSGNPSGAQNDAIDREILRAKAAERELLLRIQGTSDYSDSRYDPFKYLGNFISDSAIGVNGIDKFNAAIDKLAYSQSAVGNGYGYFRAQVDSRDIEINNIPNIDEECYFVQVVKGLLKVENKKLALDNNHYGIYYRIHRNNAWEDWCALANGESSSDGGTLPDLSNYVRYEAFNQLHAKVNRGDKAFDELKNKVVTSVKIGETEYTPSVGVLELKTINNQSIVGSGNIIIAGDGGTIDLSEYVTQEEFQQLDDETYLGFTNVANRIAELKYSDLNDLPTFKTINGNSILGSGDITVSGDGGTIDLSDYVKKSELEDVALSGRYDDLSGLPTIPNESKVSDWGFTKNKGTVTGVKINGEVKDPKDGVVDLGYITSGGDFVTDADFVTREEFNTNVEENYTAFVNTANRISSLSDCIGIEIQSDNTASYPNNTETVYIKDAKNLVDADVKLDSALQQKLNAKRVYKWTIGNDTALHNDEYSKIEDADIVLIQDGNNIYVADTILKEGGRIVLTVKVINDLRELKRIEYSLLPGSFTVVTKSIYIPASVYDFEDALTLVTENDVADWGFTKNKGTVEAVDTDEEVDDVLLEYATIQYVDNAISAAITTTLNTLV